MGNDSQDSANDSKDAEDDVGKVKWLVRQKRSSVLKSDSESDEESSCDDGIVDHRVSLSASKKRRNTLARDSDDYIRH